jgi:hypothetical protein
MHVAKTEVTAWCTTKSDELLLKKILLQAQTENWLRSQEGPSLLQFGSCCFKKNTKHTKDRLKKLKIDDEKSC